MADSYHSGLFGPSVPIGRDAARQRGSSPAAFAHLAQDPQRQRRAIEERNDRLYEEANDELMDELNDKVGVLRQLTIDIGKQSKSEYMNDVESAFDTAGGAMSATLKKVTKLLDSGGGSYMCYLVLFIFCLFLGMYLFLRRK